MINEKQFEELKGQVIERMRGELPPHLHYHSPEHTLYVLDAIDMIAEAEHVSGNDLMLLRIAVLYHDLGFVHVGLGHEMESCSVAREDLTGLLTTGEIETICGMIMATRIPQTPHTKLEEIIADADLEYLGTDRFDEISSGLYKELLYNNPNLTAKDWNRIQVSFMQEHHYFTGFCKQHRAQKKAENLKRLMEDA